MANQKTCMAVLAHVDAGKTTLTEAFMFVSGEIRKLGRVDHKDAFLDHFALERERGITIFSKEARLFWNDMEITLLDTPGHVDFVAETERTLQVLDAAVLVINGADGVQAHTKTLWDLLAKYHKPVFLFVNKMDAPNKGKEEILKELKEELTDGCVDFTDVSSSDFQEEVASLDEEMMEKFFNSRMINQEDLSSLISRRVVCPVFFGSALKVQGVEELMDGITKYSQGSTKVEREEKEENSLQARVFKITRDPNGTRISHVRIYEGRIQVKMPLDGNKIEEIRRYQGEEYTSLSEAGPDEICGIVGLHHSYVGQGLGVMSDLKEETITSALFYNMEVEPGTDRIAFRKAMDVLAEEDPSLHLSWDEEHQVMVVEPMGVVQMEILEKVIEQRFHYTVHFGEGKIRYKETITEPVLCLGHYEPLKHYAEVQLWMEPLPRGTGIQVERSCSTDELDGNFQRLILSHVLEREHRGVMIGAPLTDVKITLVAGRCHKKHTEGGDFRQAVYRGIRQGLMEAKKEGHCVILEPIYQFELAVPNDCIGRAMSDLKRMGANFEPRMKKNGDTVLRGTCPVATMGHYEEEVRAYAKGNGHLSCRMKGYEVLERPEKLMEQTSYQPESDLDHTPDSVFCSHGSGFVVPWNEVRDYIHGEIWEPSVREMGEISVNGAGGQRMPGGVAGAFAGRSDGTSDESLAEIFEKTYGTSYHLTKLRDDRMERMERKPSDPETEDKGGKEITGKKTSEKRTSGKPVPSKETFLLVDGYNLIHAWPELRELSQSQLAAARDRLADLLCDYQGYYGIQVILVFDAYKVRGDEKVIPWHNIHVVYTRHAQTADAYIEACTRKMAKKYNVRVVTSDGLEQCIVLGHGASRISSREFIHMYERMKAEMRDVMETK